MQKLKKYKKWEERNYEEKRKIGEDFFSTLSDTKEKKVRGIMSKGKRKIKRKE